MPNLNFNIDRYWIYHFSASASRSAGILCYMPASNSPNAQLRFWRDGVDIPADTCSADGVPFLNFSAYQFQEIIETLRREKPVQIAWFEDVKRGFVYTGHEPVGEEEP